jgi:hypothetical protein
MTTASSKSLQDVLQPELDKIKKESFTEGYQATNEEAMGLLLAHFFEWDGLGILRSAECALEDANFHTESGIVADLAKAVEEL